MILQDKTVRYMDRKTCQLKYYFRVGRFIDEVCLLGSYLVLNAAFHVYIWTANCSFSLFRPLILKYLWWNHPSFITILKESTSQFVEECRCHSKITHSSQFLFHPSHFLYPSCFEGVGKGHGGWGPTYSRWLGPWPKMTPALLKIQHKWPALP